MILGIFCRSDHPDGYGRSLGLDAEGRQRYGAHGYVTLLVWCQSESELAEVRGCLDNFRNPWDWPGRQDGWYGGRFDLVEVMELEATQVPLFGGELVSDCGKPPKWRSLGDNRAVGICRAIDILGS